MSGTGKAADRLRGLTAQPGKGFYQTAAAHVLAGRQVEVEGCRQVLEFEDGRLRLDMGSWQMEIYGSKLRIAAIEKRRCTVEGALQRMEFLPKAGGHT